MASTTAAVRPAAASSSASSSSSSTSSSTAVGASASVSADASADARLPVTASVSIAFPTSRRAEVARNALQVDRELNPDQVHKSFAVEGAVLRTTFRALDVRMLRVAMSSYFDMAKVVTECLDEFGEGQ